MLLDTHVNLEVKLLQVRPDATIPTYGTEKSACFDLYACLTGETITWASDNYMEKFSLSLGGVVLNPGERMLIPTGFVFGIPDGCSMRLHPRSGLSAKNGIVLANQEGVIDCDYPEETNVLVMNVSDVSFVITHGMRICQGEIVRDSKATFSKVDYNPCVKTDRTSGYGSTGV